MVWFQCEDCGENLKKPKLLNHFRMCSAFKLSCIDCGQMFDQQSVQGHNQCMTEAEKYGPKGQGNVTHNGQIKSDKPKKNSEVDVNVGLSSHAPWFCSLCNTQATSKQTLLLHADGKKHRAKARAFHASQKQSSQTEEPTHGVKEAIGNDQKAEPVEANGYNNKVQESDAQNSGMPITEDDEKHKRKKRKVNSSDDHNKKGEQKNAFDTTSGEVIQADQSEASGHKSKKKKGISESLIYQDQEEKLALNIEGSQGKIKLKKLVTTTLNSSDGVMKIKKLQKHVVKALKDSGASDDDELLRTKIMHKINSSSRFTIEGKHIRLAIKTVES